MKGETPPILQRDDRGTVAILTMNRPAKLNALSNELLAAIMEMLDSIELDAAVRVVVITGADVHSAPAPTLRAFSPCWMRVRRKPWRTSCGPAIR
jgi:1,4-dihydroxy-2-naphthoyl-CoA synthase